MGTYIFSSRPLVPVVGHVLIRLREGLFLLRTISISLPGELIQTGKDKRSSLGELPLAMGSAIGILKRVLHLRQPLARIAMLTDCCRKVDLLHTFAGIRVIGHDETVETTRTKEFIVDFVQETVCSEPHLSNGSIVPTDLEIIPLSTLKLHRQPSRLLYC